MKVLLDGKHKHAFNYDGERRAPYDVFDADRLWYDRHSSFRVKSVEGYHAMLDDFDREDLRRHIKKRRGETGEDLRADGSTDEMRERLRVDGGES
jgi:hypothetical protein